MNCEITHTRHEFDKAYREGAHWNTEKPSGNMSEFTRLLQGNERILDAGCGPGRDVIYLAQQGFSVTGIDASPIAIALAQEKTKNLEEARFVIGEIEWAPFGDWSFDAAYSGYTMRGKTIPRQAQELSRVIKPKGILFVALFTRTEYEASSQRDEVNPESFVLESFERHFEIQDKLKKTYTEKDDQGEHEHDLLKLILLNKE